MASIINASTSTGLVTTADTSGVLQLQTGGTTALTVDASQNVTLANGTTIQGLTVGRGAGAGSTNTAVGASALASNSGDTSCTALGFYALNANTTGSYNVALGRNTLISNTSGSNNVAIGLQALNANTTGNDNIAVGYQALYSGTAPSQAIAIGYQAGYLNNALYFTAVGFQAGGSNTTGATVCAIGYQAMQSNTTGSDNVAVGGYRTLYSNTTGSYNVAVGRQALEGNTTASSNTAVGYKAGYAVTTGYQNTLIGWTAGADGATAITTGFNNIVIGWASDISVATGQHQIVMGADCTGIGDNYFTFGKGGAADRVYNQFTANATWTRSSDQRLKKEIQTNTELGLGFINDIRTVSYKWKAPNELDPSMSDYNPDVSEAGYTNKMYGFIAQEVKSALDKHGVTDFAGWHVTSEEQGAMQGVSYEMFVVPLINAVKELKADLDATKAELAALKGTA